MNKDVYKQHIICIANHKTVFVPILLDMHYSTSYCDRTKSPFCQKYNINQKKERESEREKERISIVSKMNQN